MLSDRLRYRPVTLANLVAFHSLVQDDHVRRYLLDGTRFPPEWSEERIRDSHLGYTMLPTFGAKPRTEYSSYAGNHQVALVEIGGKILIARVGIGGIGWREMGDYLIAFFTDDTHGIDPVASFVVERQNTGLQSVTTSVPQPYVNTR
jgi:hypothetical protein